jgi:hypothetical protein
LDFRLNDESVEKNGDTNSDKAVVWKFDGECAERSTGELASHPERDQKIGQFAGVEDAVVRPS